MRMIVQTIKSEHLRIDYKVDKKVRVLILLDDDQTESDDERIWMDSVSRSPAFAFLKDSEEDIYTLNDGEPFYG